MTKSQVFLYFCLAFIGGIFLSFLIPVSQPMMLGLLILGIILISTFWQYKKFVIIGFCVLFLVLGILRHQHASSKIVYSEQKNITLVGRVVREPDIRSSNVKLTIKSLKNPSLLILVTTNRYPEYRYGDKLKIRGKLQPPPEFENFNYKGYLAKDGIYSVMYWPQIELLSREQFSIYGLILKFKDKLRKSIYQNLSPPQSSILGAMLLGDKRKMSQDLKQKLNVAGVRHITAISGMHVAILTAILMSVLISLGWWRQQAFYLTILIITFFIIMIGLQPSAIRAGIMGGLFLLAQYLGRQNVSQRALVFAASGMLAVNPLLLGLDVGFQLSFLAMIGIIYLFPTFKQWLKNDILAMTFSAYLFTLPLLIYNFGYFSLVGVITNFLIVPFLYLVMIFGFIFGVGGMIWQALGWVLSWPAWLLLTYMVKVVDFFSQIPSASITLENLHWAWLIISYLILGVIAWRLRENQKFKFLKY